MISEKNAEKKNVNGRFLELSDVLQKIILSAYRYFMNSIRSLLFQWIM